MAELAEGCRYYDRVVGSNDDELSSEINDINENDFDEGILEKN